MTRPRAPSCTPGLGIFPDSDLRCSCRVGNFVAAGILRIRSGSRSRIAKFPDHAAFPDTGAACHDAAPPRWRGPSSSKRYFAKFDMTSGYLQVAAAAVHRHELISTRTSQIDAEQTFGTA